MLEPNCVKKLFLFKKKKLLFRRFYTLLLYTFILNLILISISISISIMIIGIITERRLKLNQYNSEYYRIIGFN